MIIDLVKRTIRKYGKPLQILTDHGSQFYNSRSKLQSDFDSFCKEHDIEHVMGSIGKPTILGKIDKRWHRTYDVVIWKDPDLKDMNNSLNIIITKNVHMSLNYMKPKQVYKRSVNTCGGIIHYLGIFIFFLKF